MLDCEKFNPGEKATFQYLEENGYSIRDTRTDPYLQKKMDYIGIRDGK